MADSQISSAKANMKEVFAPDTILPVTGTVAVDVTNMRAIGNPNSYEYFINGVSANKITRTGVIWINARVKSVTFTTSDNFEVMSMPGG